MCMNVLLFASETMPEAEIICFTRSKGLFFRDWKFMNLEFSWVAIIIFPDSFHGVLESIFLFRLLDQNN